MSEKIADFSLMTEFGFVESELIQEFDSFLNEIITVGKKDVLNPIIRDIFQNHLTHFCICISFYLLV